MNNGFFKILIGLGVMGSLAVSCKKESDPVPDQLTQEVALIDHYLLQNVTDYTLYNGSGLRLVITKIGDQAPPHSGQTVKGTIKGTLFPDGTVFEDRALNDLIDNIPVRGLQQGLSQLLAGSKAKIFIPSPFAFGAAGSTKVPPNTTIVYEVDFTGVGRSNTEQEQFKNDTTAIRKYIKDNEIQNAKLHSSGVFYVINNAGTGDAPKPYDFVTFKYKGSLIANDVEFDANTLTNQSIFGFIDGFKVGLPLIKPGGSITLYIPSGLAYGTKSPSSLIPANSNLKFEIDLTSISK